MPSWYNLFFATFALAALLRYVDVQSGGWLFVAGLCCGVSFLFKLSGLYCVAGILLFLLFHEQLGPSTAPADRRESLWYRAFLIATVLLYEALLFLVLRKLATVATYLYFYFWLPELAIGGAVVWYEFYAVRNRSRRFYCLLRELALFGAGVAIPGVLFLVHYFLTGNVALLIRDVYVVSGRLIAHTSMGPSVLWF